MTSAYDNGEQPRPPPMGLTPDDRIDDLILEVRNLGLRIGSAIEVGKLTFNHVLAIESALRGQGVMKSPRWRDIALMLLGATILILILCTLAGAVAYSHELRSLIGASHG